MAKTTLVESDLKAGAALVRALDEDGWNPSAALWFYLPEEDLWRLIIALPSDPVPRQQDAYRRISEVLESSRLSDVLSIDDIGLARSDDQMLSLLRSAISTGPGISGIRFTHNTINNVLIEDATSIVCKPLLIESRRPRELQPRPTVTSLAVSDLRTATMVRSALGQLHRLFSELAEVANPVVRVCGSRFHAACKRRTLVLHKRAIATREKPTQRAEQARAPVLRVSVARG